MIKQAQDRPKLQLPEPGASLVGNLLRGDTRGARETITRLLSEADPWTG